MLLKSLNAKSRQAGTMHAICNGIVTAELPQKLSQKEIAMFSQLSNYDIENRKMINGLNEVGVRSTSQERPYKYLW